MSVQKLTVLNFRNLSNTSIELHPSLNFFVGENGSGKSSILEAVFFTGHGKSFRTTNQANIVTHSKDQFVVNIKNNLDIQLGISRNIVTNITDVKVNGERLSKLSDLAKNLAVQIITPESFKLFFGGPKERRRFLDLGLFHVKHGFSKNWKIFSKLHRQRNACLRNHASDKELDYWTSQFCDYSMLLTKDRLEYSQQLQVELNTWLKILLPDLSEMVQVDFYSGWSSKKELSNVLGENLEREKKLGYGVAGAHKFDIKFTLYKQPLDMVISRGQQKLFLLALTFAQAKLIQKVMRVKPILLIDDVGAELDINSRNALAVAINCLGCQVIATAINKTDLQPLIVHSKEKNIENYKMFHVKQGEISVELK